MAKSDNGAQRVGGFIRHQVIPAGMSVTEAARRLGVGRPALSNLLNGRAALSPNMALRLQATFGADRARLLELQAAGDRERRSVEDRAVAVGVYAPSFLTIKARQIEEWAGNIEARDRLPVLLRRLVHATGRELRRVDFPGYDNAQRHGWDGRVEADAATLWVPEDRSFWEFGVDKRPKAKADRDYRARLVALPPAERAKCTFVFVTPRNWPGKDEWVRGREAAGDWKAVRALDASDLEQWLENTIAPRIWLADELGIPNGFETVDHFWDRWAKASEPPMSEAIFASSVAAHLDRFTKWLKQKPDAGPLAVAADSREEAVAFLACLFRHDGTPAHDRDRAVVFESAATLRTLAGSPSPFIPIVYSEDTEREIASHYRERHCVVIRPRNAVDRKPDVAVELLGREAFGQALADMGVTERDRIDRLASESGRSPTVLRRRLSPIPAIGTPSWARDADVARSLLPMALVGAWHKGSPADCEVLAALAGRDDYDRVEKDIVNLFQHDDSPVWYIDQYRGVVSKIDALFAVSPWMTAADVTDFVDFAEYVLSESDPALELPPDDRRWAGLYGKLRKHSDALRTGICETLVMLSVHGNALFRHRLGGDAAADVAALVKRLLTPFTSDKLRSHDRDLPGYAEAAPGRFLELLETDLRSANPALLALLRSTSPVWFDSPARTGVLWALERLAWNPQHFPRVVTILARLSETEVDDDWENRPINSLLELFRSCSPQTAASLDDRIRALETVWRRFPGVGWRICIQQFEGRQQPPFPNNRPRWREDAAGAGHGATESDRIGFVRKALALALSRPVREHDEETLGDLIERLHVMDERDRAAVWHVIDDWARTETDKRARALLRAKIGFVVLRWGQSRGLDGGQMDRAREVWTELGPKDPVGRHAWLFAAGWLDYPDDALDIAEFEKRVDEQRREAMKAIWTVRGFDGALELAAESDGWTVGRYAAGCAAEPDSAGDVLRTCLSTGTGSPEKLNAFTSGFISCLDEDVRSAVILAVAATAKVDQRVCLFKCAPFRDETWRLLDRQDARVRDRYWREVSPLMARFTESETSEVIDRLVEAGRPWEAFSVVGFDWAKVETSRLKRLLAALVEAAPPPGRQFNLDSWSLSKALDSLDGRPGVTVDEMAQLEFAFIDRLDRSEHGIPNIERRVAKSPALFVQALALSTTRDDDGQDPMEWRVDDPGRRKALGHAAYLLLDSVGFLPGVDTGGRGDADVLSRWVAEARRLCAEHGRAGIGDERIGQLLSRAPAAEDGSWPCRAVCEVLQTIASRDVAAGFEVGVYNARGVHSRSLDEGGVQERALSAKYRAYAERLTFDYPYVANILERIAEAYDWEAEREDSEVLRRKRLQQ